MKFSKKSKLGSLFLDKKALAVLEKYISKDILFSPLAEMAMNETLEDIQKEASEILSVELLEKIINDLNDL